MAFKDGTLIEDTKEEQRYKYFRHCDRIYKLLARKGVVEAKYIER
jgi:hypothetical protein